MWYKGALLKILELATIINKSVSYEISQSGLRNITLYNAVKEGKLHKNTVIRYLAALKFRELANIIAGLKKREDIIKSLKASIAVLEEPRVIKNLKDELYYKSGLLLKKLLRNSLIMIELEQLISII